MTHIKLTDLDLLELQSLSTYLIEHHPDIVNQHVKYTLKLSHTKANPLYLFGSVIGYKGKVIYEVMKSKIISSRSLDLFTERFATLEKNKKGIEVQRHAERAQRLRRKLVTQIINEDGQQVQIEHRHSPIALFKGTKWYIYERFTDYIVRKVIQFEDVEENVLPVEIKTARVGMLPWIGTAYTDSTSSFLIIRSYNKSKENSLPTNYLVKLNSIAENIDLCIGHMSFPSDINQNVITKTVVLEKVVDSSEPVPQKFDFSDDKTITIVGEEIYKFLYDRRQNRLSTPHHKTTITSRALLSEWHTNNEEIKRESRNKNIITTYDIYYKRDRNSKETAPIKDKLEIKENIQADLVAHYYHEVETGKPQEWKGDVSYSPVTRAVFIALQGPVKKSSKEEVNTIFLILNLPSGERDFEILTGIISGIRDNYDGSIGMLVVAVKQSQVNNADYIDERLETFFNAFSDRSSVMPPKTPIATFTDLERSITEG